MQTSILVQPIPLFSTLKPNSKPKPETISKSKPVSSICPLFLFPPNSHFLPTKISAMNAGNSAEMLTRNEPENDELIVETCFSRTLPPALTLHHGLQALKDAVLEFKLNPPSCSSGFVRFQVAVPPTASALNWFCCQPESSGVFPQFYLSKQSETLKNEPALSSKSRGVFGIGAAVCFRHSTSSADNWNSFRRYLLVESLNVKAYGFIGINYDIKSSIMKHETASFYFVIPQIELNEYESCCMLTGTLVWGGSTGQNLNQALLSCERSLFQAVDYIPPMRKAFNRNIIGSAIRCFNIVKDEDLEMVYIDTPALGACDDAAALEEMKSTLLSCEFCIRLSVENGFCTNMFDQIGRTSFTLQDCANINAVWASLIVEECSRLGLTYFCVAPGSRSSPLAVAASSHPCITCIACYDERSLAFHALGYARGSQKPAVVITTSGTAVSNLYPAVVEASQDFVPLLLLTADRPPELHEAGANQAIDQVNHFGSYVRFFFHLPPPTDHIAARMVLTTVDSAVNWATCTPYGPVHLNCSFREPLENSPRNWDRSILDKLDSWNSSSRPFTQYINSLNYTHATTFGLTTEIEKVIQNCERGLLVVGAVHTEEEMWAALVLARHLSWPSVADILSGVRLRKLLTSSREYTEDFVFIDHFDHLLLCDAAIKWAKVDVIIQIGSKITSKRISQFLEHCFPCPYIMVDKHPCRHDPSHIVTHRIQSTISEFAACLLKSTPPRLPRKWSSILKAVDSVVAWALSFRICSEYSLTEPYVAHVLSEVVVPETALFFGNSMPIRDADMYSQGVISCIDSTFQFGLPCQWMQTVGNRGASGIDGLLSTATGFAVGCKKRILCVVGDVSFLHDTNGLAILSSRMCRKPITVVVINNRGGGIFSFLPIAGKAETHILEKYFYLNHSISISKLCDAHGVKHLLAETKLELQNALFKSQQADEDYVIEVSSSIDSNTVFHSVLKKYASQVASHAFTAMSRLSTPESTLDDFFYKVEKLEYWLYGIHLSSPPTTVSVKSGLTSFLRQGFILAMTLDDGSTGYGEIAPLEIHKENLQDVEEQLRFFAHALKGATIDGHLPLLGESFSVWIWKVIGVPPISIFPSVRCGLEMAVLNAIAARQNCSLLDVLWPQSDQANMICQQPASIDICALLDSNGPPKEVAKVAFELVGEGFRALKVKVARRNDPKEDAEVVKEIRYKIGADIELRVDANRKWTYEQAIEFGSLVKDCGLQYIEEPVELEDDIVKFCEVTGLPVALDETIDNIQGQIPDSLARFTHPGVVALVVKPSVVGGFEKAAAIASWAHIKGKLAVISSTFETSIGLSSYVQLARYLDMRSSETSEEFNKEMRDCVAHGLGTYKWLQKDVTVDSLVICRQPHNRFLGASISDADDVLRNFQVNPKAIIRSYSDGCISTYQLDVKVGDFTYLINVNEIGESADDNVLLFLHGFLGTGQDWIPIMKALSVTAKCISIDLPGHGRSNIQPCEKFDKVEVPSLSVEAVAAVLSQLLEKVDGAIIISGSPGLKNASERKVRAAKDDSRARSIISFGLVAFLDTWYCGDLWKSFREHPSFKNIIASRSQHDDIHSLAKALSDMSIGRQPPLWEDLRGCKTRLRFIVGEKDTKFKKINQQICNEISQAVNYDAVEVPGCGHAVHLENPLALVILIREFYTKSR
ncbi:hypothetical protein KSS87_013805 [Heliosperma pusillum]|nr:hypothetical protein KSS87_013805 [Heliosperma pusillum]